eukprot:CFRG7741T1
MRLPAMGGIDDEITPLGEDSSNPSEGIEKDEDRGSNGAIVLNSIARQDDVLDLVCEGREQDSTPDNAKERTAYSTDNRPRDHRYASETFALGVEMREVRSHPPVSLHSANVQLETDYKLNGELLAVGNEASPQYTRTMQPKYHFWHRRDLHTEWKRRITNKWGGKLEVADGVFSKCMSTAKAEVIAEAFLKNDALLKSRGQVQWWRTAPVNITPERKSKKMEEPVASTSDVARMLAIVFDGNHIDKLMEYEQAQTDNGELRSLEDFNSDQDFWNQLAEDFLNIEYVPENGCRLEHPCSFELPNGSNKKLQYLYSKTKDIVYYDTKFIDIALQSWDDEAIPETSMRLRQWWTKLRKELPEFNAYESYKAARVHKTMWPAKVLPMLLYEFATKAGVLETLLPPPEQELATALPRERSNKKRKKDPSGSSLYSAQGTVSELVLMESPRSVRTRGVDTIRSPRECMPQKLSNLTSQVRLIASDVDSMVKLGIDEESVMLLQEALEVAKGTLREYLRSRDV